MCLFNGFYSRTRSIYLFKRFVEKIFVFCLDKNIGFFEDYSPFIIYMRRNRIGGISVKYNQQYIDENSNYDDLWERFVTITDIHNGYEFAFDEVNETIYWTQIKSFLPDGTPTVRISFLYKNKTLGSSMKFVELILMEPMKLCCMVMMKY